MQDIEPETTKPQSESTESLKVSVRRSQFSYEGQLPLLLRLESEPSHVEIDNDGNVWYVSSDFKELLADGESLCGITDLWATASDDVFLPACQWHDRAYRNHQFLEDRGWNKHDIDEHFYHQCLLLSGCDEQLQRRAAKFYTLVRMFGWLFYYR